MLFDLRGRGRRRTVKIIYIGLAVLIGVGLVGFGIGGGFGGGGLLTAANNNGGSNKASFSSELAKYRKLTQAQPTNVTAWEGLVKAELHEAGGEAYLSNGQLTSKGRELYSQLASTWNSYLALNPPTPSASLARGMLLVFSEEGLNEPPEAVKVLQIAIAAEPNSFGLYQRLAVYAYKSHNPRVGDLAAAKAVSLAPAAERASLKLQLAAIKKNPTGESTPATTNGSASTGASGATQTLTATSPTSTKK